MREDTKENYIRKIKQKRNLELGIVQTGRDNIYNSHSSSPVRLLPPPEISAMLAARFQHAQRGWVGRWGAGEMKILQVQGLGFTTSRSTVRSKQWPRTAEDLKPRWF